MTGLSTGDYQRLAVRRLGAAKATVAEHVTSAYTGVCLGCGRPGPCGALRAALEDLARYGPVAVPTPTAAALTAVADGLDSLRFTWASVVTATDRAGSHLHGVDRPGTRLTGFHRALTDAWQALGEVYAGLHAARDLPDAPPATVGHVLGGLRAARNDADRAAALATVVRRRLTVAADRVRRTGTPAGLVAARRFTTAIARLDLVVARLAVGGLALDRYAHALTNAATPDRPMPPAPPRPPGGPPTSPPPGPVGVVAAGARAAHRLVAAAGRRNRPGRWARVRHQLHLEAHP